MKNGDAKFVLAAYRPSGKDATDPFFAEALTQARSDPELGAWFTAQVSFDAFVAEHVRGVQPPPGLRDAILAGVRVSRPKPVWWRRPRWFAALAASLLFASAFVAFRGSSAKPPLAALTRSGLRDAAFYGGEHLVSVAGIREIEERLASMPVRFAVDSTLDLARMRATGCRTIHVAGREVFEICFGRDHEFHLYIARAGDFAAPPSVEPEISTEGRFSAATWSSPHLAFSLVTTAGVGALRQRL